ncbi:histidine kinase [Aureimonas sp. SA4125]|uniref:hybrid sensor histidine kinase/response regulator n=1 Tax=Aureimonas sp. SA4125 TaxID=2826993 RepID=UPI001CC613B0|nr:PAS domain-containing sensor histidine kinase [Aureimonas sp. SA4125]BDA85270.1 histidine kinase [Aureimonas sp. SA4125]
MEYSDCFEPPQLAASRYQLLVEAVTDYAIYMLDPSGVVASWNAGAQRFKGYADFEIIGEHFSRFYLPEERASGVPQRALDTAASVGRFEAEGWRLRKDGGRFWAHVVIDAIRSPDGKLLGFAKITRDLTERKIAEEALQQSEQQFRLLVQGVKDHGLYMLDTFGRITSWNFGAERISGYAPAEIIGEHFSRFYTPEDRESGLPTWSLQAAKRDGCYEGEGWRQRKDGSRFWSTVVINPIRSDRGELVGFAKVTRDTTAKRDADLALLEAREIAFQAQKMEAIGRLTGGIAHDFNNLLMAILGSLELLKLRLPPDPRVRPLIDNAIKGAERGAALTQRMLAFARRQALEPVSVDLQTLVSGITDLLTRSLGSVGALKFDIPEDIEPIFADPNQIELALLNLTMNASDANSSREPIVIAARSEKVLPGHSTGLKPGAYICLSVTDRGDGMDAETLARVREPFFTTKGIGKGTGLGLSMVDGLTDQSGGRLVLKSVKGEGTTAELWLPAMPLVAKSSKCAAGRTESGEGRKFVILAVDDDALVLMNTVALLEDLGHTVFDACSGKQALDILRREKSIDLLITDYAMPHMTGLELATVAHAERPKLPVVLATGYIELPPGIDSALPMLSKPFRQKDLVRLIDQVMVD